MIGFARYVFKKWFDGYQLWTAIVSLVALFPALLGYVVPSPNPFPPWLSVGVAILFAYVTALLTEWSVYKAETSEVKCDMPLFDVLRQITGAGSLADAPGEFEKTLTEIRETALHGRIKVWGRPTSESDWHQFYPPVELPSTYWNEFAILYDSLHMDDKGKTWRVFGTPSYERRVVSTESHIVPGEISYFKDVSTDMVYSDLYFSRTQIDKVWRPKRRLKFWRSVLGWLDPSW